MDENKKGKTKRFLVNVFAGIGILAILGLGFYSLNFIHYVDYPQICRSNLKGLSMEMLIYASDNNEKYPTPDKWCDLLIENTDVREKMFICLKAKKAGSEAKSHYAMNPNAEINSPNDTVLLFETSGGWNQFGGPELITAENHEGKGCNVLFVDRRVEFVAKENFDKLNWGEEKAMNNELVNNE